MSGITNHCITCGRNGHTWPECPRVVFGGLRGAMSGMLLGETSECLSRREPDPIPFYDGGRWLKEEFIGRGDDFWDIDPGDEDSGSLFRDTGLPGVSCTGYAFAVAGKLRGIREVAVVGFLHHDNPGSAIGAVAGGHDFAVVEGRFIVDPWLVEFYPQIDNYGVYDLEGDRELVERLYGDRDLWTEVAGRNA